MSFDIGQELMEKTLPYDAFVQIIDGATEIIINAKSQLVRPGEGITLPAHQSHFIKSNERIKMILAIIKAGYE